MYGKLCKIFPQEFLEIKNYLNVSSSRIQFNSRQVELKEEEEEENIIK